MNKTSARQQARVQAAVSVAERDFQALQPSVAPVIVIAAGTYAGHRVVAVTIGAHDYVIGDGDHASLVVNLVRLLQVVATSGNTQWPTIPGIGALTAAVRDRCAIWAMPNGTEFCGIGHLFAEES